MTALLKNALGHSLRRHYVDEFHFRHVAELPAGSRVIDLGGHKFDKRGEFDIGQYDLHVTCVNISGEKGADVIADVAALPFPDNSFDVAICSEVLEHVPNPLDVIREAYRVLRHQGTLLICVPFMYQVHGDPHDYGRYTEHFWQQSLRNAGFKDVDVEHQGSFWSVLVDMIRSVVHEAVQQKRPRVKLFRSALKRSVGLAKRKALQWDRQSNSKIRNQFTTGYGVKAKKAA